MEELYLAVDGDNVGSQLEYFVLINDIEALTRFSHKFSSAMIWFEKQLTSKFAGKIIFYGGDNLLACFKAENFSVELLEELRLEFTQKSQSTLSVGLGNSPQQAYFALKFAKTSGKNCIRQFEEFADG